MENNLGLALLAAVERVDEIERVLAYIVGMSRTTKSTDAAGYKWRTARRDTLFGLERSRAARARPNA